MASLEEVYAEWQNNLEFRKEFKKNPQKALEMVGLTLSETDLKKIVHDFNIDRDDLLDERISK